MNKEQKMILEMVKDGKVSVEEAQRLLDVSAQEDGKVLQKSPTRRFLRVFVVEGDKTKVNINVPVALAEVALKLIPKDRLSLESHNIDLEEILKMIDDETWGELINIDSEEGGKQVKVRISID